jgi:hypothetical protein
MVVSIQTYGDLVNWQPHLHALVSAGVVNREGVFTPLALPPAGVAEELFRRRVIRMLVRRGRLEEDVAAGLLSWRHSGFSVRHAIRVDPCDTEGLERLCRHIPPPGFHLTRLYGAYANRTRGALARRMARAGERPASGDSELDALAPSQRARRRQWARLIAKVFEVDPLRCACGAPMRVIAFILDPVVIRKILQHRPRPEPRAHAPPPG